MIVSDVARAVLAVGLILTHRFESLAGVYVCHVLMVAIVVSQV